MHLDYNGSRARARSHFGINKNMFGESLILAKIQTGR